MFKFIVLFLALTLSCFAQQEEQPSSTNIEQTLSIIKPEAVANNDIGLIVSYLEAAHLKVVALRMTKLSKQQAEAFYAIHKDKPFFAELTTYMSSGPVVAMVLEGKDAVANNRKVMGATNPSKAEMGTIRADFGSDITHNAVHGSDSIENAKNEIAFFFKPDEIFSRS